MKLELFYIVRVYSGSNDRVGRSADCELVAGPFSTWFKATDAKLELFKSWESDLYDVVKQTVEVEL